MLKLPKQTNLLKRPIRKGDIFEFVIMYHIGSKVIPTDESNCYEVVEVIEEEKEMILMYKDDEGYNCEDDLKRVRFIKGRWMENRLENYWSRIRQDLIIR